MANAEQVIKEGAAQYLESGEEILVAAVVAPRGNTQRIAGARELGVSQTRKQMDSAEAAGFVLEAPMALALTDRRLLALKIGAPIGGGIGGKVKDLLGAVPISEVNSIQAKRLLIGSRLILTIRGVEIKLEAGAGAPTKPLAEAFQKLRTG